MERLNQFYIGGKWVAPVSDLNMPVINPATERQIGTLALGIREDVDHAVAAAKAAFSSYSVSSKTMRIDLLHKVKDITKRRFEDLAQAMRLEMGAPITMSRNAQTDAALGHLESFIDALKKLQDRVTLANGDVMVREPIGVCGRITPWN